MQHMLKIKHLMLITLVSIVLSACASSNSGSVYSRDEARTTQTIKTGIIESVRTVKIEGTRTPIGTAAGSIIGGVAGSTAGGGRGSQIFAALGAVIGGLAGAATEEVITRKDGVEITVQIDGGALMAIVQEKDQANIFKAGDRVRLVELGNTTRVTH